MIRTVLEIRGFRGPVTGVGVEVVPILITTEEGPLGYHPPFLPYSCSY